MILEAHAALAPSAALMATRRDVYRSAAGPSKMSDEVLDNPLVRNALRGALLTEQPFTAADAKGAQAVLGQARRVRLGHHEVPVVAAPEADDVLAAVLDALGTQPLRASFRTTADGAEFDANLAMLSAGGALATRLSPGLVDDLLPHLALVGILRPVDGRLSVHSASPRHFPGMALLADPRTDIEAAEMLLHEAAHARYYDMVIAHDLLPGSADEVEPFAPSWRAPGTAWPLEQSLAALHAYTVLAEFAAAADVPDSRRVGPASLLPEAGKRLREIGQWVYERLDLLGADAPQFVCGLLDREPPTLPTPPGVMAVLPTAVSVTKDVHLRFVEEENVMVVGRAERPGDLYLLGADSGHVLTALLNHRPVDDTVRDYATRHHMPVDEAGDQVRRILTDLARHDLIAVCEG